MSENRTGLEARLRDMRALSLVMSAEEAAGLVKDGMTVGVSGFTPSGYPKAVPLALAERAKNGENIKIDLYSGASVGPEIDTALTEAGVIRKRLPYHTNATIRGKINEGEIEYIDIAVVNLFWTHFLKNYSCSLMFNTIGIQYLTLPQKLQSNIIDIDGRIEYRPTEIVAVIY